MHDIALLNTLGVKLVLVAGSRPQLNRQLSLRNLSSKFDCGLRITGRVELECALDAAGSVRFHIESYLGRGIVNSPGRARTITISSGNFITAQPVGVRGGVDYKYTGEMRRLNVDKVRAALDDSDIVLISSIAYSASGEVFNCLSEQVASKCAIQLESSKLIFMYNGEELRDTRSNAVVQTLVIEQAQQYVELARQDPSVSGDFLLYLKESIKACVNGVKRSHLVSRHVDGGLLQELFTRDGEGIMISRHMYEGIRMATTNDIVSVMRLIQPLLDDDVLVSRDQEHIESNVNTFTVVERDGAIIACCTLQPYENNFAEMGCVAVDPTYRNLGKGNAMLGYVMRKAAAMGVTKLFVLTTRTSHWFLERGFVEASVKDLPPSKLAKIDLRRKSKVYICDISTKRALDEKELLLQMD
uniref:amino-acid N-acetyltransferase n=1 Tax=Hyaloperonospora arabidopsidis (strain Emoy2) TaxID=559515 RepID=M4BMD8_HYAAE